MSTGCTLNVDAFEIDALNIDALAGLFAFDCGIINRRCSKRVIEVTHVTNQACDCSRELSQQLFTHGDFRLEGFEVSASVVKPNEAGG